MINSLPVHSVHRVTSYSRRHPEPPRTNDTTNKTFAITTLYSNDINDTNSTNKQIRSSTNSASNKHIRNTNTLGGTRSRRETESRASAAAPSRGASPGAQPPLRHPPKRPPNKCSRNQSSGQPKGFECVSFHSPAHSHQGVTCKVQIGGPTQILPPQHTMCEATTCHRIHPEREARSGMDQLLHVGRHFDCGHEGASVGAEGVLHNEYRLGLDVGG